MSSIQGTDALVTALAAGTTVAEAAQRAGISERTAYRRLAEPHTKQQIQDVRAVLFTRAGGRLADVMDAAVATLVQNLSYAPPSVQVRVPVALLEQALKLRTSEELAQPVAALEVVVAGQGEQRDSA